MTDDVRVEEVMEKAPPATPEAQPNFWDSLKKKFEDWGVIQEPSEVTKEQVTQKQGGGMVPDNMEDDEEDKEEEEEDNTMTKSQNVLEAPVIKAFLDKQEELHKTQLEAVSKSLEEKYQKVIEGLTEQVDNLSKKSQASEEEVERREMIAKASMYRMFPVPATELANMMLRLKKSDPDGFDKWEALIKAADNQLGASALFGEIGSSRTPEEVELLDAAMKKSQDEGISLKDAMLSMPAYKQQELLEKSRQRAKGGR